jgi:SAF domain
MTTTIDPPATAPANAEAPPRAARAVRPAINARLAAVAVGIIVLSVAGAAALFATVSGTAPVVVAAAPLAKGQIIGNGDLTTAAVAVDPTVQVVPASQLAGLVGQRAAVDVPAGALLTPASVTGDPVPGPGQALIGIPVTSSQAPLAELAPGTPVHLVQVPESSATGTTDTDPADPVPAVVVSSGFAPDGMRVIDVTVAAGAAPAVTAWASTGQAAVVVDTVAR